MTGPQDYPTVPDMADPRLTVVQPGAVTFGVLAPVLAVALALAATVAAVAWGVRR